MSNVELIIINYSLIHYPLLIIHYPLFTPIHCQLPNNNCSTSNNVYKQHKTLPTDYQHLKPLLFIGMNLELIEAFTKNLNTNGS